MTRYCEIYYKKGAFLRLIVNMYCYLHDFVGIIYLNLRLKLFKFIVNTQLNLWKVSPSTWEEVCVLCKIRGSKKDSFHITTKNTSSVLVCIEVSPNFCSEKCANGLKILPYKKKRSKGII